MNQKEQILQFLITNKDFMATAYGVKSIALFGSFARGNANPESDNDILVEMQQPDFMLWSGLLIYLQQHLYNKVGLITAGKHHTKSFNNMVTKELIYA